MRLSKVLAFAIASPARTASSRTFFCPGVGSNGLPFSMPIDFNMPMNKRSRSATGSLSIASWTRCQYSSPRGCVPDHFRPAGEMIRAVVGAPRSAYG